MYADHTPLEAAGQALIAFLFLGTAAINSTMKAKQHADRIAAQGIPFPWAVLWAGFAMQYAGGIMIALDVWTDIGAVVLIVFTVLATAIFHRFWEVEDPLRRHLHQAFVFSNCAICGGLLLLI